MRQKGKEVKEQSKKTQKIIRGLQAWFPYFYGILLYFPIVRIWYPFLPILLLFVKIFWMMSLDLR